MTAYDRQCGRGPSSGNGIDIAIRALPRVTGTEPVVAETDPTNRGHDRARAVLKGLATETASIASLSPAHPAEIVAFASTAGGSTVSGWIARQPVYGRRCPA